MQTRASTLTTCAPTPRSGHTRDSRPAPSCLGGCTPRPAPTDPLRRRRPGSLHGADGMSTVSRGGCLRPALPPPVRPPPPSGPAPSSSPAAGCSRRPPSACTVTAARTRAHRTPGAARDAPGAPARSRAHLAGQRLGSPPPPTPPPARCGRTHLALPPPRHRPGGPGVPTVLTERRRRRAAAGEGVGGRAPRQTGERGSGVGGGAPRVPSASSPPPGDCPRPLLGNKGAGRGRRVPGTQGRKEGAAHLPTEVPGG